VEIGILARSPDATISVLIPEGPMS